MRRHAGLMRGWLQGFGGSIGAWFFGGPLYCTSKETPNTVLAVIEAPTLYETSTRNPIELPNNGEARAPPAGGV